MGSALQNKQRKVDLEVLESRTRARKNPSLDKVEVSTDKDTQPSVEMAGTEVRQQWFPFMEKSFLLYEENFDGSLNQT